ncbi:hypothetical protein [uncultured Sphingomonas sp.]|uniref:hypothetical protein n=1 Tax=uncultured Sphingomonas sp. TaxID=158754 RepID=UPI0035CA341C
MGFGEAAQVSHGPFLDRRAFSAALLAAGGCVGGGLKPGPKASLADAHTHMFNVADLPVEGFLRYVVARRYFAEPPSWLPALISLFTRLYKPAAITAQHELALITSGKSVPADWGPKRFAAETAAFIETGARSGPTVAGDSDRATRESFEALGRALSRLDASGIASRELSLSLDAGAMRRALARIASGTEYGDARSDEARTLLAAEAQGIGELVRLLAWGHLLLQSRSSHLASYIRDFGGRGRKPALVVALLVDYDAWLDDEPAPGSDQMAQISVMHALGHRAAAFRPAIQVATFAGYCPLRHALELARGVTTTFERLQAEWTAGRIAGFKLYPPMGYKASGNAMLADVEFDPRQPGRVTALDRWSDVGAGRELGSALDEALDLFLAWCGTESVPIVAHGGPGNGAGPRYGERADPAHWEAPAARHGLRLSIGHLVDEAKPFVNAVSAGRRPPEVWALHAPVRMLDLRLSGRGEVYGDLSYMPELAGDRALAREFFSALTTVFGPGDPALSRIVYATDWVMLGMEPRARRFADAVMRGMADAQWSDVQIENVMSANARRLIRRGP